MADTTKNIKFNFDDGGSLKKISAMYDEFMRTKIQSAQLYSQNVSGNPATQQQKYLKEELDLLKEIQKEKRKDYEERKRQLQDLLDRENVVYERVKAGHITGSQGEKAFDDIAKQRRQLLSGTGYRKDETYIAGAGKELGSGDALISKIEQTLEESNIILRGILSNDKESALNIANAIYESSESTQAEILAAQQALVALEDKRREREDKQKKDDLIKDLFRYSNLNNILTGAEGVLTSDSAVEAVRKAGQVAVDTGVSIFDGIAKLLGGVGDRWLGKGAGAWLESGTMILGRGLGVAAKVPLELKLDSYLKSQEYLQALYANQALFGSGVLPGSMSQFGYSLEDSAALMNQLGRSAGSSRNIAGITRSAQLLERGFGVENNTLQQLLEVTRSNSETDKNMETILAGIWQQGQGIFGGNRTFLNEFIAKNFIGLQRELQQNQARVSSGSVMSALNMFNSIGGQFGALHPNSMGLISSINQSLMNPSGDAMDALTFTALRQHMPGASLGDILVERQRGLSSPNYFRAVMNMIGNMGGGEDYQMLQVASAFGINYEAARDLVRNRGSLMNLSSEELRGKLTGLEGLAAEQTTQLQRHNAELTDAKIQGAFDRVSKLIDQMKEVWTSAWDGATFTIDPATGRLTGRANTTANTTKKPTVDSSLKVDYAVPAYGGGYILNNALQGNK